MTNTDTSVKEKKFEDYLRQLHAKDYTGTDDDMPDDFEHWLMRKDVEEIIALADSLLSQVKQEGIAEGKRQGVERLISKYASSHEVFCEKKGKQFKKCLRCVLDDELKSLSQKKK